MVPDRPLLTKYKFESIQDVSIQLGSTADDAAIYPLTAYLTLQISRIRKNKTRVRFA